MTELQKTEEGAEGDLDVNRIELGGLAELDRNYFEDIRSRDKKLRSNKSFDYPDYRYFTVLSTRGEKMGIVGIYDTENDKHLTDTIVDPKYRGMGLAKKFKDLLMKELDLPYVTLTIDYDQYAPDDPSRTNTSSMRAAQKLPGVRRIEDPALERIQKAKFVYKNRGKVAESLSEDKVQILRSIKERIDAGELDGMDWGEIRRGFWIPMQKTGDKDLILSILGPGTLMKYFAALTGEARPYKFALPLEASDLSEYLNYELSDAPAYLIVELLEKPLSRASVNILMSHCVHIPHFVTSLIEKVTEEKMNDFIKQILKSYPGAEPMLGKVFDKKRVAYLKELEKYNSDNPAPQWLIDEFNEYERSLFGKSTRQAA